MHEVSVTRVRVLTGMATGQARLHRSQPRQASESRWTASGLIFPISDWAAPNGHAYRQNGRSTNTAATNVTRRTTKARLISNSATDSSAIHGSAARNTIVPVRAAPITAQASTSQRPHRRIRSTRRQEVAATTRRIRRRTRCSDGMRSDIAAPAA
jgi:hypothetical protein